jgi:hypothetical protein
MPRVSKTPENLKAFEWHGLELSYSDGSKEALADCPFCGRAGKFSVNIESGLWRCLVCASGTAKGGGNIFTFLRLFWTECDKATLDYSELATHRGLLFEESLLHWGIVRSILTNEWLVPGYNSDGEICNLYRYSRINDRFTLLATPTLGHGIHGYNLARKGAETIYVCEGIWDAAALWEVMIRAKLADDEKSFTQTGNPSASLLGNATVLAIPGLGTIGTPFERWLPLFAGKRAILLFDNDHPREHPKTQAILPGAAIEGTKRAAGLLSWAEESAKEILFLNWGPGGVNSALPSGFDVRDKLKAGATFSERLVLLKELLTNIEPVPLDWLKNGGVGDSKAPGTLDCEFCNNFRELTMAWRKAMHWIPGLDHAISVMLSSIASVYVPGPDQLWFKIVGPPSCGKSTLSEALSINEKYVIAKSTIRGFHSGYKTDREGEEDHSLIVKCIGKTLITKDGDALLQAPNLAQILSEARDIYDGVSRAHYRHGLNRDYKGRMTWLICGTNTLRALDKSELGERCLDVVIMDQIDEETEMDIATRKAFETRHNLGLEYNEEAKEGHSVELVKAYRLTGGYINWLRSNINQKLAELLISDEVLHQLTQLAKFVSFMRARPSAKQQEAESRELSGRLVGQFTRLAACLAVVLNRPSIDDNVMERVTKVAVDTARGQTMEICRKLQATAREGLEVSAIMMLVSIPEERARQLLSFLRKIGALEHFVFTNEHGIRSNPRWRLTESLHKLWANVVKG